MPLFTPSGLEFFAGSDAPNLATITQGMQNSAEPLVLGVFATAAARTTAYSNAGISPAVGKVTLRTDAMVYEWWTGTIWHPMPGGLMATVNTAGNATSAGANGTTEALFPALSLAIPGIVSGKNYRVVWGALYRVTIANTLATAVIHASQAAISAASPVIGSCGKWVQQISNGPEDVNEALWTPGASGTWNLEVGVKSTAGTGNSQMIAGQQNAFLTVYAA